MAPCIVPAINGRRSPPANGRQPLVQAPERSRGRGRRRMTAGSALVLELHHPIRSHQTFLSLNVVLVLGAGGPRASGSLENVQKHTSGWRCAHEALRAAWLLREDEAGSG